MGSGTFLSKRGEQYALPANKNKLLDILRDVWHPTDNPKGYLNLGIAENVRTLDRIAFVLDATIRQRTLKAKPKPLWTQTLMQEELLQYINAKVRR